MSSDPLPIVLNLIAVLFLVLLNGFFVSAEFAMVKVRGSRIDMLMDTGNKKAVYASNMIHNLDAYLSACQLGITLASLGLGWIGEPAIASLIEPLFASAGLGPVYVHGTAVVIAFIFITILHIVLGELAPKTIAIRNSETITLYSAALMTWFYRLMYPFIWVLNGLANQLLRLFRIEPASEHDGSAHTEEEIRILMKESNKSGLIDNTELALVDNIFDFATTMAREIMIPRTEMICLYSHFSTEENLAIALDSMRTRYPICGEDKDHIIGFIHIKDLLRADTLDTRTMIRPILAVPESTQISDLLKRMQRSKTQIAILIDEYGGTSGLVTLEDIMEEIVGEIQDEFDQERPVLEHIGEEEFSIDGMMLIEAFNDRFGLDLNSEDFDTVGGWMYSHIEAIPPQPGQSVAYNGFLLVIEETENKRISRVRLMREQAVIEEAGA
ncbi:hemolysin family protein [Paenibacillus sp. P96]|uniref:Hemolysin family protein n=1 Tax=Paenibacillus zeirhizosphaerae TaxID=2987519 RepID=A0ABT9FVF1_9BACL|nr:hemolysin family protein [Paenibacillus sp. P96]MDP4098708.1 hemolysin family protein [Paenibacillus sp. P96]